MVALGLAGFGLVKLANPGEPEAVPLEAVIEPVRPALVAHPSAVARSEGTVEVAELKPLAGPTSNPSPAAPQSPRPRPSPEASAKPTAPDAPRGSPEPAKIKPSTRPRSMTQRLEAMKQTKNFDEQQFQEAIATLNDLADKDRVRYREAIADIDLASRKASQSPMKAVDILLQAARVIDP
jgi:hypothetical protein